MKVRLKSDWASKEAPPERSLTVKLEIDELKIKLDNTTRTAFDQRVEITALKEQINQLIREKDEMSRQHQRTIQQLTGM